MQNAQDHMHTSVFSKKSTKTISAQELLPGADAQAQPLKSCLSAFISQGLHKPGDGCSSLEDAADPAELAPPASEARARWLWPPTEETACSPPLISAHRQAFTASAEILLDGSCLNIINGSGMPVEIPHYSRLLSAVTQSYPLIFPAKSS